MARPPDETKRGEILACARRLFSRQGFHNTSIADLTRETGLPVGTIYTYFASKEDLMLSIIETGWEDMVRRMRQDFQAATDLQARISLLAGFFFQEMLVDSDLINILLTEAVELTGLGDKLDLLMTMVESLQAEARSQGWQPGPGDHAQDRAAVVVYFLGMLHASRLSPTGQLGFTIGDIRDFMQRMVFRSLGSERS
jgi:AcrR family transcriptional regulator